MGSSELRLFDGAEKYRDRVAMAAPEGIFTYGDLLGASERAAAGLLDGAADLREERVCCLTPPGFSYAAVQWGTWRAGGVAVPLAVSHPPTELEYVVSDTGASTIVAHPQLAERVRTIAAVHGARLMLTTDLLGGDVSPGARWTPPDTILPSLAPGRRAMILYTSGTTSRPKGVVTTHGNIESQVSTLVDAWEWRPSDHILLILPLHHVHGIINVLTCALWSGAKVTVFPNFDAGAVCDLLAGGELTLFMAVPTIYSKLMAVWDASSPDRQEAVSCGCRCLRLMVSGSAALPVTVLERWKEISGHVLLERYGMTEIGMAISNPLHGTRRPGFVGFSLPGVDVQLVDEAGERVEPGAPGEIEVRSGSVFLEYWNRPEVTLSSFRDGWFRTGDVAVVEDGCYRILGRSSVDIIKTGGYKVSALEIEEEYRNHPAIQECAVVGVEDPEWGERVAIAVVPRPGEVVVLAGLRQWGAQRLAPYKLPTRLLTVDGLPRNAMGKVTKPEVKSWFPEETPGLQGY